MKWIWTAWNSSLQIGIRSISGGVQTILHSGVEILSEFLRLASGRRRRRNQAAFLRRSWERPNGRHRRGLAEQKGDDQKHPKGRRVERCSSAGKQHRRHRTHIKLLKSSEKKRCRKECSFGIEF